MPKIREEVRRITEEEQDAIIVASFWNLLYWY